MKHIGRTLYKIIEKKGAVKRRISMELNMDPSRFSQIMNKETIDPQLLERICTVLDISPGYFFDDWTSDKYTIREIIGNSSEDAASTEKNEIIRHLEESLQSKDAIIAEKERIIKLLAERAGIEI